jgi:hypothetical protein
MDKDEASFTALIVLRRISGVDDPNAASKMIKRMIEATDRSR